MYIQVINKIVVGYIDVIIIAETIFLAQRVQVTIAVFHTHTHKVVHFFVTSTNIEVGTLGKSIFFEHLIIPIYIRIKIGIESGTCSFYLFPTIGSSSRSGASGSFIISFHIGYTISHFRNFG